RRPPPHPPPHPPPGARGSARARDRAERRTRRAAALPRDVREARRARGLDGERVSGRQVRAARARARSRQVARLSGARRLRDLPGVGGRSGRGGALLDRQRRSDGRGLDGRSPLGGRARARARAVARRPRRVVGRDADGERDLRRPRGREGDRAMSARDETVLAAGGLLPLDASIPEGEPVNRVEARAYSQPALPGRAVVRLTAENLAAAADLELDVLGFTAAEVRGPVGFERRRALRFPGSAILSDPKNARYALDVVKDLRKAARKAKSKPGHAKELVDAIGSPARSRTSCHRSMKRWGASSST